VTSGSCAIPAWLSCELRSWNSEKTGRGTNFAVIGEKTVLGEAIYQEILDFKG
jgi:hypothetical protein